MVSIEKLLDESGISAYVKGGVKKARQLLEEHGYDIASARTYDSDALRFTDFTVCDSDGFRTVTYCWG